MLSIFILLFISIAVVSGLGFMTLTIVKSGETSIAVFKNQTQIEQVVRSITSDIIVRNGIILLPLNADADLRERIPSFAPYKTTVYGTALTYCPISPNGTTPGEGEYVVEAVEGRDYLRSGGPSFSNQSLADYDWTKNKVGALVLIPGPAYSGTEALKCEDVELTSDNSTFLIAQGSVQQIFYSGAKENVPDELLVETSQQMTDAIQTIKRLDLTESRIRLVDNVSVEAADLNSITSDQKFRTIKISGNPDREPGNPSDRYRLDIAGNGNLIIAGHLELDGINVANTAVTLTTAPMGALEIVDSTTENLVTDGGNLVIGPYTNVISADAMAPVTANGGKVRVSNSAFIRGRSAGTIFDIKGGELYLDGSPDVDAAAADRVLSINGNGVIAGAAKTVDVNLTINAGSSFAVQTLYPVAPQSQSCNSGDTCAVSCPINTKVVTGTCSTSDDVPVALIGTFISGDRQTFSCKFASEVISSNASAHCDY